MGVVIYLFINQGKLLEETKYIEIGSRKGRESNNKSIGT